MSLKQRSRFIKLVLVLATSMPMTAAKEDVVENVKDGRNLETTTGSIEDGKNSKTNLAQVPYIRYHNIVWKKSVLALYDLGNKVNTLYLAFAKELGLSIRPIDIGAPNMDNITLDINKIVVLVFSMTNKANQKKNFEKIFLVANVSLEAVLRKFFLTLNSTKVDF